MYKNLGKVKGFEKYSNYLVSDDGRIINCKNGKELSGHKKSSNDYERRYKVDINTVLATIGGLNNIQNE